MCSRPAPIGNRRGSRPAAPAAALALCVSLYVAACESAQPPTSCGVIPQVTLNAGETAVVPACFNDPNGDALTYTAVSSRPEHATAAVSGSTVTVTAVAPGNATVTITAMDPGNLKSQQTFQVAIPNRAPEAGEPIPGVEVFVADSAAVDVSKHFSDPDGEPLTYAATSSNPANASVSISGSVATVSGSSQGSAVIAVTARDPGGLESRQTFQAIVPNRAPAAGDPIPDMEVFVGDSVATDVSEHFIDPDGDALTFEATSSSPVNASVSMSGSVATARGLSKGSTRITVAATDPGGLTAEQSFRVIIPNRAPRPGDPIPDMEVFVGDSAATDVSEHFIDPDGDALTFAASTSDARVAVPSVSGNALRISGAERGIATLTVTATDSDGLSAEQTFVVTVVYPDRSALVALYNATDGPNWKNNDNWLTDAPLGSWYGVDTARDGRVTRLALEGRYDAEIRAYVPHGLSGSIPPELGNLDRLLRLSLAINELTGPIPSELGKLADLREVLNLSRNQLSGEIPPELGRLTSMQWLYLHQNELTGPIPSELGELADLRVLNLSRNQLSGEIPPELGNLANLRNLHLNENELTGPIPSELGKLANLWYLELQVNRLSGGIPPDLGTITGLRLLAVSQNQLTGTIPADLGRLTRMHSLYLQLNKLTGPIPPDLGRLTSLESLAINGNELTGPIPPELARLADLKYLYLSSNQLSDSIPPEIGNLANLQLLRLDGNLLTGEIPPELGRLTSMRSLHLHQNELTGPIPPDLGRLANLRYLYLTSNQLSDSIPPEIGNLTNLQLLLLDDNLLTGEIPAALGRLNSLGLLRVNENKLTGEIPDSFLDLDNLKTFWFEDNDGLCAPDTNDFSEWLARIHWSGLRCDS